MAITVNCSKAASKSSVIFSAIRPGSFRSAETSIESIQEATVCESQRAASLAVQGVSSGTFFAIQFKA
jgi:hypothetical protein